MKTLTILVLFFFSNLTWAYPNFIGHGYSSCLTCHYNPFGNGPLNDYGRAVSAAAIASKHFSGNATDEDVANRSGFFYKKPKNNWFRPGIDYRGLYYIRQFQKENQKEDYITMDANTSVVIKLGNRDQYLFSGSVGYAPRPHGTDEPEYRSREYYLGWRATKGFGIYAGLMDKVYGIRIPDHIAYSRILPQTTQNDQVHGVILHYNQTSFDLGVHAFAGNLTEKENNRPGVEQRGFSTQFEYSLSPQTRLGFSGMNSNNDYLKVQALATHVRAGFGKGSSIMSEVGYVKKDPDAVNNPTKESLYYFLQGHINLTRGLYFLTTAEYQKEDISGKSEILRIAPGIQYFPAQRYEFRMDLYNTKRFSENAATEDRWDLALQLHLWY